MQNAMNSEFQVITGCSSGIGRATAFALAKSGHRVVAAGRDMAAMRQLSEEARVMRLPGDIEVRSLDVTSRASVDQFTEGLARDGVQVTTLVNNAGVSMTRMDRTRDGFERTWAVNVRGPYMLTATLARAGLLANGAMVMNLASKFHAKSLSREIALGTAGFSTKQSYLQSKLCVLLLTHGMAQELADVSSIRVNAVHPGIVKSRLGNDSWFARAVGRTVGLLLPPAAEGARRVLQAIDLARSGALSGAYIEDGARGNVAYQGDFEADAHWLCTLLATQIVNPQRVASHGQSGASAVTASLS